MNFLGHAWVASWHDPGAHHVLGAMLPDFASMLRAPSPAARDDAPRAQARALRAGIALHHRSDAAFHRTRSFLQLYRDGARALDRAGLARGAARGAAHVGVELLLDGTLLDEAGLADAYLSALDAAPGAPLDWGGAAAAGDWRTLFARLRARGLPREYASPGQVAPRVARALAGRPRLALSPGDESRVAAWLQGAHGEIAARAPGIWRELRERLATRPGQDGPR